jgi:hypothetical protein
VALSEDRKRNLLQAYDKQRGRIARGAQVAVASGGLATVTGHGKWAPTAAALGGAAGYADKVLEEHSKTLQERHNMNKVSNYGPRDGPDAHLHSDGQRERAQETFQGVLESLFSKKARMASLSDEQLGSLFPKTGKDSYGHSLRAGLSAREASSRTARHFNVK